MLKDRVSSVFFSELGMTPICKSASFDCASVKKTYNFDVHVSYMAMLTTDQNRERAIKLTNTAEQFITTPMFNQLLDDGLPEFQIMDTNLSLTEGVITFGKMDSSQSFANKI